METEGSGDGGSGLKFKVVGNSSRIALPKFRVDRGEGGVSGGVLAAAGSKCCVQPQGRVLEQKVINEM